MERIIRNLFKLVFAAGLAVSCNDLELDESVYHTKTWQFSDFSQVKSVMTNVYGYLEAGFNPIGTAMRDCASDDAICALNTDPVMTFYDGSWSSLNLIDDKWEHYYAGIRAANYLMENCPEDFEQAQYQEDYKYNVTQLKNFPWEARALRAYFHFELLKRYNSIVIADRIFTEKEVAELVPVSYQEAAEWIAGELEICYEHLPNNYGSGNQSKFTELGRVTKGFALAARTRVLLYAASPLANGDAEESKWIKAAKSAQQFLDMNTASKEYILSPFSFNNENSKDLVFGIRQAAGNAFESYNFPIGYEGGSSGTCPTHNLAEAFDLANGTEFRWGVHKNIAMDPTKRDPRFAKTILSNGDMFKGRAIESYYGGQDGLPRDNASPTSYYLRKFIQESTSFESGNINYYQHVYPVFRFAEVYLNYAEALSEATGDPYFKGMKGGTNFTMSPVEAVNLIRKAAGMPELGNGMTMEHFRNRLRKERRVELAFEDHRFWDVRRWKIGGETVKIYGLDIRADEEGNVTSFEKKEVADRYWDEKMNFYPIPLKEMHKNTNLIQNTGW